MKSKSVTTRTHKRRWKSLKSLFGLGKVSLKSRLEIPTSSEEIKIEIGQHKLRLDKHNSQFHIMGHASEDIITEENYRMLHKMRKELGSIQDENRFLEYKQEVLLELLAMACLDSDMFEKVLLQLREKHITQKKAVVTSNIKLSTNNFSS